MVDVRGRWWLNELAVGFKSEGDLTYKLHPTALNCGFREKFGEGNQSRSLKAG
jgi:hypothetical protein